MYSIQKIEQEILQAVKLASGKQFTPTAEAITSPPDPKWGDVAFPCFAIGKGLGRPPTEVAAELAPKIHPQGLIAKAEARGPFINFFVDPAVLAGETIRTIELLGSRYGSWTLGRERPVMVEFAQPNTHKAIHVGHLRNFVLGQAVVNLLRAIGYNVIPVSYHGDVGTHVATTLWALRKFHAKEKPPKTQRGLWLGKIYAEGTTWIEEHPEDKKDMIELGHKLEAGDRALMKLWKQTRAWSMEEAAEIFKELGLTISHQYYESEMDGPGKKLVTALVRKGIAKQSEGAIVVPLESYGLETFLVLKSDGSSLYSTRDLALAHEKFTRWKKITRSVHVVDMRQSLYFKQLFKTLELMGFTKPMVHVPYEFVTTTSGAMSSRKGTIVSYEEFRDEVIRVAAGETKKRHPAWSDRAVTATARRIAFAAMRYGMLAPDVSRTITFDVEAATSFEGATGPYLQYTGARISSILKKVAVRMPTRTAAKLALTTDHEKQLVLALTKFPAVVRAAADALRPSIVAMYLFDLAKRFSSFYEIVPVLRAPEPMRTARLRLIHAVRVVLENGSQLLGIEIPKEM